MLTTHYAFKKGIAFLRRLEHALQYLADQQTQILHADEEKRGRIAANVLARAELEPDPLLDEPTNKEGILQQFDALLHGHREAIRGVYSRHIRSETGGHKALGDERNWQMHPAAVRLVFRRSTEQAQHDDVVALGFREPKTALHLLAQLERRSSSPFSPRAQNDVPHCARLATFLLSEVSTTVDPDATLARLVDLFSAPVHQTLVERLAESPRLARVICRVLGISAPLSRLLCKRSGMEAILFNGIKRDRLPRSRLLASLRNEIGAVDGPIDPSIWEEGALARMRKVQGRVLLSEGMGLFAGLHSVVQNGYHLSLLADALLQRAYEIALGRILRRFWQTSRCSFCRICTWIFRSKRVWVLPRFGSAFCLRRCSRQRRGALHFMLAVGRKTGPASHLGLVRSTRGRGLLRGGCPIATERKPGTALCKKQRVSIVPPRSIGHLGATKHAQDASGRGQLGLWQRGESALAPFVHGPRTRPRRAAFADAGANGG